MNNFKLNEALHSPDLKSYITSPRNFLRRNRSESFLPFFVERDGVGRLIDGDDKFPVLKKPSKPKAIIFDSPSKHQAIKYPVEGSVRSSFYLKTLMGEFDQNPQIMPRFMEFSSHKSSSPFRSGVSSPPNLFESNAYQEIKKESSLVALPHFEKNNPNHSSKGLPQGSKFKLISKERIKNVAIPIMGSYNPEKAHEFVKRKSPRCIIMNEHQQKKSLKSSSTDLKTSSYHYPPKTERGQLSNGPGHDLFKILHTDVNNQGIKEAGSDKYFKFSIKPIESDPALMKFNTTMLRGLDKLKKDVIKFKLKLNSIGLKLSND